VLAAYRALPGYPPEPEYEVELADVPGRAGDVVVAVDDGGRILGCVTYVPGRDHAHAEFSDPDAAGFRMLAVDPSGQGKGVGRALVQWCIDAARADGRQRILIHSGIWMTRAHALYQAMGFERRPEMDWIPIPEVHLLGFALEL